MKLTSKDVTSALKAHFKLEAKYTLSNSFVFDEKEWETDFLLVKRGGNVHEIEIKVGKTDFQLDARKHKHRVFYDPFNKKRKYAVYRKNIYTGVDGPNYFKIDWVRHLGPVPHRFSYACEEGLIKFEEVPAHAGLMWITEAGVKVIKVAPQIHAKPLDLTKILLEKYYYQAMAFEEKWHAALEEIKQLKQKLNGNS